MERIARDTYDGKIKPGELDPEHIKKTHDELSKGAAKGYGENWKTVDETGKPSAEVLEMQKNIFRFSGAKNAEMLERINRLLTENGKVKPWSQFKNDVLKLNKRYNVNYLQAEWQTANEAGRKAQIWKDYVANADLFPNLVYRTQLDDRVRPEHQTLEGIIKPVDDPFWDSFYPPNGWRCRCYTVQTAEDPTPDESLPEITEKDVRPEFRNNVGKTGQIYKEDTANGGKPHPYFALVKNQPGLEKKIDRLIFKTLQNQAIKNLKDKNVDTQEVKNITFSVRGIKETMNQNHDHYEEKNWLVPHLDKIIKNAIFLGRIPDKNNNKMVKSIIVFKTTIKNSPSYILIREMKDGRRIMYSISSSSKFEELIKNKRP